MLLSTKPICRLALSVLLAVMAMPATAGPVTRRTRFMMGSYVTIQAVGPEQATGAAIDAAMDRIGEIDRKYSSTRKGSPVHAFNHQGRPITDPEMVALIRAAQAVSRQSEGAFDITVYPLVELWGFRANDARVPSPEAIGEVLARVGHDKLKVTETEVSARQDGVQIDLGGIAKGLAVQAAVRALQEHGVKSALVDAGGDVYAYGTIEGGPWRIGIRNPRGEGVVAVISADNLAVVTSGDYERFFEQDGVQYHHLLDPHTGYPARGFASVTVFARSAILADAWATALFVLGPERATEVAEGVPQIEAILIAQDGGIQVTEGLTGAIEIVPHVPE